MSTTEDLKPFLVTRKIDYTVTQKLVVMAQDDDDAHERIEEFTEGSDWGAEASLTHRVVQLSDAMEQIENTCEVTIRQLTDNPVSEKDQYQFVQMAQADVKLDASLTRLSLEQKAQAMWELLQKVYRCPHMYTAGLAELGMDVKTFVETEMAAQATSQAVLAEVMQ